MNDHNPNEIKLEAIANDNSKVTQIGTIIAGNVYLGLTQQAIDELIKRFNSTNQTQISGILRTGDPYVRVAYWQGRQEEITQLYTWLQDENVNLIGIEGIGGIGKSSLAAIIFESEEEKPYLKRFWADVSTGTNFTILAQKILTEFGYPIPEKELELVNALMGCLNAGQYLLVIDNLESLLKEDHSWQSEFYEEFFRNWLECGQKSTIVITTRERPQVIGFNQWLSLKGLKRSEGAAMLQKMGIKGKLEDFSELVDGHPLLLQLVGNLLLAEYPQDPSLEQLADLGLGNLRQLLINPKVVGQHRQQDVGLALVLDASFNRLDEIQQKLFLSISVYRGEIDAEAAVFVLEENTTPDFRPTQEAIVRVEQELRNLRKRSFLEEDLLSNWRYFSFLPLVLEYARYQAGDQTQEHQKAIIYYTSIAQDSPWKTLEDVHPYLELFYHTYQLGEYDAAFDTLKIIDDFLTLQGYYAVQVEYYSQLVEAYEREGDLTNWKYNASLISLGNGYIFLGSACQYLGKYQEAFEYYQQSLRIFQYIGNVQGEVKSLINLGYVYDLLGNYQEAFKYYRQSLRIFREIGNVEGEADSLVSLGNAYYHLGRYQKAFEYYQQSLRIFREIGNVEGEANSLVSLGTTCKYLGKYQESFEYYRQSLRIFREIGNVGREADSLISLGDSHYSLGKDQEAFEYYQQSLRIFREIGNVGGEADSLISLGGSHYCLGRYQEAVEDYQQSLRIFREIGNIRGEADSWFNLGLVFWKINRKTEAKEAYLNARQLYQAMNLGEKIYKCNIELNSLSENWVKRIDNRAFIVAIVLLIMVGFLYVVI